MFSCETRGGSFIAKMLMLLNLGDPWHASRIMVLMVIARKANFPPYSPGFRISNVPTKNLVASDSTGQDFEAVLRGIASVAD